MRVLVLEDDDVLCTSIATRLRAAGFAVDTASDLDDAAFNLDVNMYDCVVLDRMLPSGDSIELLASIRRVGQHVPALFLTARDSVDDRVAGFEAGGDDYLTKPFAMDELVVRVRSLCRRAGSIRPPTIIVGDLSIDVARREVTRAGMLLPLTGKEFSVLEMLANAVGTVVTRADLIEHCWDELTDPISNTVDVHVASLRRKLGAPDVIRTVRGAGYLMEPPLPG